MATTRAGFVLRTAALAGLASVLVAWREPAVEGDSGGEASAVAAAIELLALDPGSATRGVPAPWRARAVRGERAPDARVVDSAGGAFLRIEGSGRAGWFVRPVDPRLPAAGGRLHWSWRVPVAPAGADLRAAATDDAALRVFVAFGPLRRVGRPPRSIFYSLGGGEPAGYERPGHHSPDVFVVRVGAAADARDWTTVRVDPHADYVRAWGDVPPPIAVVGLLQDTDQTDQLAVADIRSLRWSPAHAVDVPDPE